MGGMEKGGGVGRCFRGGGGGRRAAAACLDDGERRRRDRIPKRPDKNTIIFLKNIFENNNSICALFADRILF